MIEYSVAGETETKRFKTVRERLEELVDEIQPLGATPIQETLTEAARYWRGGAVKYGLNRNDDIWLQFVPNPPALTSNFDQAWSYRELERYRQVATVSHPGSYCKSETDCGNADTNATGVTPTDKYGVHNPAGCDPAKNPNTPACKAQKIKTSGALNYLSPFSTTLECQRNFQVLLTDGLPSQGGAQSSTLGADGGAAARKAAATLNEMKAIMGAGATCAANSDKNQECTPELAAFLAENDQSSTIANMQTVQTHTIAFALNNTTAQAHLQQIASKGKGNFYIANSEEALLSVFEDILARESVSTTVAAPAVPANAFNRLFSRGNIYFGAFAPAPGREGYQSKRWGGNLKKYPLCLNPDPGATARPGCRTDADLGAILDAAGNKAIGGDGEFRASAKNLWHNTGESGAKITQGGAGGGITDYTRRTIYTDINNSGTATTGASLSGSGFLLNSGNWKDAALKAARDAVCVEDALEGPAGATPDEKAQAKADCEELMPWTLGRDVDDEDGDTSATDTRFVFSDVLHARPVVATYDRVAQADGSVKFTDRVLVATNAGGLHFIDGDSGDEKWAFLPNTLLARQVELRANATLSLETGERHAYGLDATPVLRIDDRNNDGRIQAGACPSGSASTDCGDKVHVYLAMRRGGNAIYALDISDPNAAPKFLWRIDGVDNSGPKVSGVGQGDFSRMGQTFSEPVLARINTSTGRQTVLIFGGGYDGNLDSDKPARAGTKQPGRNFGLEAGTPNTGNAIYVVNADTGDLIFWIGHAAGSVNVGGKSVNITASGADIEVPDMFYAIASTVNVFDSNADGLADRLYVGDTAGNVWRVDLGADIVFNGTGAKPEGATVVGRFANLSTEGTLADERRIFYRPAVVQVRDTRFSNAERGEYDYVVVGTGNRANPLATGTDDRLYALRDAQIGPMSDSNNDGVANDYPKTLPTEVGGTSTASTVPLDNGDLVQINADLTTGLTGSVAEKGAEGWYLDLKTAGGSRVGAANRPGEKALAPPLVLAGNILFSTYIPVDPTDPCSVAVGNGRAYNLGVLTGRAGLNWDKSDPEDGSKTTTDAVKQLQAGGIPPQVVPVYTTDGIKYLVGKETLPEGTPNRPVKTYWYLERE